MNNTTRELEQAREDLAEVQAQRAEVQRKIAALSSPAPRRPAVSRVTKTSRVPWKLVGALGVGFLLWRSK